MTAKKDDKTLMLKVKEALSKDVGRAIARIDPEDMKELGLDVGESIEINGKRRTVAKIMPCYAEDRGKKIIQMDGISRENAQIGLDEKVRINIIDAKPANKITLSPLTISSLLKGDGDAKYLGSLIEGLPVMSGDKIRATFFGSKSCDFKVVDTIPDGVVLINAATLIRMEIKKQGEAKTATVSYEDIGGLGTQIQRIREMIELPLRYPQVFERLGIGAPKGVLLHGPPGCITGESLVALEDGRLIKIEDVAKNLEPNIYIADLPVYPPASAKALHVYDVPETIELLTETGKRLRMTPNHPLLTSEGWREAEKLKVGEEIKVFNWIPSPQNKVPMGFTLNLQYTYNKNVSLPSEWDEDIAFLLGAFVAEGDAWKGRIAFTINQNEEEFKKIILDKMLKFGPIYEKISIPRKKRSIKIRFCNAGLSRFFEYYHKKEIPSPILLSPNNVAAAFLKGLFEGDGSVMLRTHRNVKKYKSKEYKYYQIERTVSLKSSSRLLLEQCQTLLLRFAISSRIYDSIYKSNDKILESHVLYIRGRTNLVKFTENICFASQRKNEKLKQVIKSFKRDMKMHLQSEFEKIKSLEKKYGWQRVYDFEVPTTHSFFSNGILSHNTGKTLIARAVANETDAYFTHISGPEVMGKFYGESEGKLRAIFEDAQAHAPAIIFIDEIDAIAPKREEMGGEKQVERRVVAQLLALMDGLESRGQIIVIGATNIPNTLDPALRRPGRFDREISIPIPDKNGRLKILEIHTRGMPLAEDVSLEKLAEITHGFVGADLEALAREAAMSALRKILPKIDFEMAEIPYETLMKLEVTMDNFLDAMKEVEPSAIREVFVEVPDVKWSDVGGLEDIKEELKEAVEWPLKYSDLFKKAGTNPPKGILLYGVPGTGKTLLGKAIATESGVNFISVKGPSLISKYVGESEKAIREVFKIAKQASPTILFFDEIDSIVPRRGSSSTDAHVTERVISQFLTEMDGIEELKGVVVLAATNRLDLVDPAILRSGRFDILFELPKPDEKTREEIFKIHTKNKPLTKEVDLKGLAGETEGKVGADIEFICRKASMLAIREYIEAQSSKSKAQSPELKISKRHFEEALRLMNTKDTSQRAVV